MKPKDPNHVPRTESEMRALIADAAKWSTSPLVAHHRLAFCYFTTEQFRRLRSAYQVYRTDYRVEHVLCARVLDKEKLLSNDIEGYYETHALPTNRSDYFHLKLAFEELFG
jgi:hypothetical protein